MSVKGVFRQQYVLKFRNVWIWSERGGQNFSNKSEIQKSLKYPIEGGGSSLFWKMSKMFPFFNHEASPKLSCMYFGISSSHSCQHIFKSDSTLSMRYLYIDKICPRDYLCLIFSWTHFWTRTINEDIRQFCKVFFFKI